MERKTPKYALIDGRESILVEVILHAFSNEAIFVFEQDVGNRRYVSETEWIAGAEEFARYAAERRLVTSESVFTDDMHVRRKLEWCEGVNFNGAAA